MRTAQRALPSDRITCLDQERDLHDSEIRNRRTKLSGEAPYEFVAFVILATCVDNVIGRKDLIHDT